MKQFSQNTTFFLSLATGLLLLGIFAPALAQAQTISVDALYPGRGDVDVQVPSGYNPAKPTPLLILLHGRGLNGAFQEGYMQFGPLANLRGFLYIHPNGIIPVTPPPFAGVPSFAWNATDACCGDGFTVDDSGYLLALINDLIVVV